MSTATYRFSSRLVLTAVTVATVLAGCAPTNQAPWTYVPPTASPSPAPGASPTPAASGTPSASATPASATAAASATPAASSTAAASGSPSASAIPSASASPFASPGSILPQGSDPVTLDPADFVAVIDNPFWSLPAGARWTYVETDASGAKQQIVVEVTPDTRQIMGIAATVVHDQATQDGEVVEDTFDWYAQDSAGNVWYLGEDTKEYENGQVVSTEGSWEAGVNGALPGIVMPANPQPGMTYRQEYYAHHAEDVAIVLSLDEQVALESRAYAGVLMTRETTALEPDLVELKFYAPGVGLVLELGLSPELTRSELVQLDQL